MSGPETMQVTVNGGSMGDRFLDNDRVRGNDAIQNVQYPFLIEGDVPNFVEIGRAVAAIDATTRLSVVRQHSCHAVGLMFAQIER